MKVLRVFESENKVKLVMGCGFFDRMSLSMKECNQQTGKDFEFTEKEAQTVTIVRIEIERFFGKKRSIF